MIIGTILIVIGILISILGWWKEVIYRKARTKIKKVMLYTISVIIVLIGLVNILLFIKASEESNQIRLEKLVLTDLKIKFEVVCSTEETPNIGHIVGSPLKLMVYSKKDTLISPFCLFSPIEWEVTKLSTGQIRANIFFSADPEMLLIGKRIIKLEQYDAIKYPLGMIAKSLNLQKAGQILKTVEAIYINGIEIRKVEMPIEYTWGNSDLVINETTVNEWFSRPFRNCEKEYLLALRESSKIE